MVNILELSAEVLHKICAYLDSPDLHSLALTSRKLQLCAEVRLYKSLTATTEQAPVLLNLFHNSPLLADRVESVTLKAPPRNGRTAAPMRRETILSLPSADWVRQMLHTSWGRNYPTFLLHELHPVAVNAAFVELLPLLTKKVSQLTILPSPVFRRFVDHHTPLWIGILDRLTTLEFDFAPRRGGKKELLQVLTAPSLKTLTLHISHPYLLSQDATPGELEYPEGSSGIEELNIMWNRPWYGAQIDPISDLVKFLVHGCRGLKRFKLRKEPEPDAFTDIDQLLSALRACEDLEQLEIWISVCEDIWNIRLERVDLEDFPLLRRVIIPTDCMEREFLNEVLGELEPLEEEELVELERTDYGFELSRFWTF